MTVSPRPVLRTSLEEAFSLARITEARFEDERSTTTIVKTNDLSTDGPKAPVKEVVDNDIESEVVVGLPGKFQEGDMVDALLRVEQKSSRNWKELDNEGRKVEMDTKRGEPTILATFDSDRGITIWDPEIKSAFQDNTLRARWFRRSEECYALSLG
nr:hypothetical protein [Tanacetum cinerariifolium]